MLVGGWSAMQILFPLETLLVRSAYRGLPDQIGYLVVLRCSPPEKVGSIKAAQVRCGRQRAGRVQ